jgi:hypothetical protein
MKMTIESQRKDGMAQLGFPTASAVKARLD